MWAKSQRPKQDHPDLKSAGGNSGIDAAIMASDKQDAAGDYGDDDSHGDGDSYSSVDMFKLRF